MKTTTASPKKATRPNVLVVYGGWDGHQPKACTERYAAWMKTRGFRVTIKDSMDIYTDAKAMKKFDLVVPAWTMGEISKEQEKGLLEAIKNGCAIAGWHGGMCDSFRNSTEYQFMTGGQWVVHPGGVVDYTVNELDPRSQFTAGLKPFKMKSEQYYLHTDPSNKVYAWTTFSGKHGDVPWIKGVRMPVIWTRMYGKGRVFYTSLGHVNADFDVPEAFEIVKRGIQWAAGLPIVKEYKSK